MDIQAILPQINNAVNLSSNSIKCGDEFEKLLQQVNENTDIAEMKKFLDEKCQYGCCRLQLWKNRYRGRNV